MRPLVPILLFALAAPALLAGVRFDSERLVVKAAPDQPEMRYHLGMVYLKQGKSAEARHEIEQALKAPNFPSAEAARRALESLP